MQTIYMDENEGSTNGGTNPVGVIVYAGRSNRCVERECIGRPERKTIGIQNSRRIFSRN